MPNAYVTEKPKVSDILSYPERAIENRTLAETPRGFGYPWTFRPSWDRKREPFTMNTDSVKSAPPFEGLIRSREAARLLGLSEWLLRKLAHEGQLTYIQRTPFSPLLFDPTDLRKWVEREKVRANSE